MTLPALPVRHCGAPFLGVSSYGPGDAFSACFAKHHEQRLGLGTLVAKDPGRNPKAAYELRGLLQASTGGASTCPSIRTNEEPFANAWLELFASAFFFFLLISARVVRCLTCNMAKLWEV